jgi:hypothetical protein
LNKKKLENFCCAAVFVRGIQQRRKRPRQQQREREEPTKGDKMSTFSSSQQSKKFDPLHSLGLKSYIAHDVERM